MRLKVLVAALSLATLASASPPADVAVPASQAAPAAQQADLAFAALADRAVNALTRLFPADATWLGDHRYDSLVLDVSASGRAARLREWQALRAKLGQIDPSRLGRENQVDFAMLANELSYRVWDEETLQTWAWNPRYYNDQAANE